MDDTNKTMPVVGDVNQAAGITVGSVAPVVDSTVAQPTPVEEAPAVAAPVETPVAPVADMGTTPTPVATTPVAGDAPTGTPVGTPPTV